MVVMCSIVCEVIGCVWFLLFFWFYFFEEERVVSVI